MRSFILQHWVPALLSQPGVSSCSEGACKYRIKHDKKGFPTCLLNTSCGGSLCESHPHYSITVRFLSGERVSVLICAAWNLEISTTVSSAARCDWVEDCVWHGNVNKMVNNPVQHRHDHLWVWLLLSKEPCGSVLWLILLMVYGFHSLLVYSSMSLVRVL